MTNKQTAHMYKDTLEGIANSMENLFKIKEDLVEGNIIEMVVFEGDSVAIRWALKELGKK